MRKENDLSVPYCSYDEQKMKPTTSLLCWGGQKKSCRGKIDNKRNLVTEVASVDRSAEQGAMFHLGQPARQISGKH